MKARFFIAALLLAGASLSSFAQGYKDGIEFYKIDDMDNAKVLLMRNLDDAQTDKAEAYYYLGQIALRQNNVSEAASYFDKGLAANPNNPYNLIGQAAVALKNGGNASDMISKARKMVKKDCALETEIARVYYNADPVKYAKEIEKCIKQARKWNVTDPTVSNFEGDRYADQRQWGDAAGCYESAFTSDADNVEAYVKYADAYFNVNPTYAIERLREIIGKVPNSALVQRQLAEKLYENGDLANAAKQYGSYINSTKNTSRRMRRAIANCSSSRATTTSAMKWQPNCATVSRLLMTTPLSPSDSVSTRSQQASVGKRLPRSVTSS